MNMNQYEVMYVIDPALEDSARTEWGKRRLAYAIQYKTEGYYVLMYIKAPAELPRELERNMQINDSILRYLTVRYEGELPAKREPLKPYAPREAAAPAADAAEAAEAPAAEAPVAEAPVAEVVDDEKPESEAE